MKKDGAIVRTYTYENGIIITISVRRGFFKWAPQFSSKREMVWFRIDIVLGRDGGTL